MFSTAFFNADKQWFFSILKPVKALFYPLLDNKKPSKVFDMHIAHPSTVCVAHSVRVH